MLRSRALWAVVASVCDRITFGNKSLPDTECLSSGTPSKRFRKSEIVLTNNRLCVTARRPTFETDISTKFAAVLKRRHHSAAAIPSPTMPDDSTSELKNVTFKIYMTRPSRIKATYKDKHELFEAFKKRVTDLGVPLGSVFCVDSMGAPVRVNTADRLMKAAEYSDLLHLHVISDNSDDDDTSSSSGDEVQPGHSYWWRRPKRHHHSRNRSRSRDHSREGRSRSKDRSRSRERSRGRRHHPHSKHHHGFGPASGPPPFWDTMMDPRFGRYPPFSVGFGRGGSGRGGGHGRGGGGCGRGGGRGRFPEF